MSATHLSLPEKIGEFLALDEENRLVILRSLWETREDGCSKLWRLLINALSEGANAAIWEDFRRSVLQRAETAGPEALDKKEERLQILVHAAEFSTRKSADIIVQTLFHDLDKLLKNDHTCDPTTDDALRELTRGWWHVAMHTFLETKVVRAAEIPVALASASDRQGILARLKLELLPAEEGVHHCSNHPRQLIEMAFDLDTFLKPMLDAWKGAFEPYVEKGPWYHGRWELLPWERHDPGKANLARQVREESLTGATYRAWSLLLQGKVVDPRVLVICRIGSNTNGRWQAEPVSSDGVELKVAAACSLMREGPRTIEIDRIAVVGKENRNAAWEMIKNQPGAHLDLVDLADPAWRPSR